MISFRRADILDVVKDKQQSETPIVFDVTFDYDENLNLRDKFSYHDTVIHIDDYNDEPLRGKSIDEKAEYVGALADLTARYFVGKVKRIAPASAAEIIVTAIIREMKKDPRIKKITGYDSDIVYDPSGDETVEYRIQVTI